MTPKQIIKDGINTIKREGMNHPIVLATAEAMKPVFKRTQGIKRMNPARLAELMIDDTISSLINKPDEEEVARIMVKSGLVSVEHKAQEPKTHNESGATDHNGRNITSRKAIKRLARWKSKITTHVSILEYIRSLNGVEQDEAMKKHGDFKHDTSGARWLPKFQYIRDNWPEYHTWAKENIDKPTCVYKDGIYSMQWGA